jgi:hypothetical protein
VFAKQQRIIIVQRALGIFSLLYVSRGKPLASKAAVAVVVGNRRFFFDAHQNLPF